MTKVELLCPAGNYAAFEAALYNGADAIFLAGPKYGARASADNFSLEEIKEATKLAHLYGVKIHVTLNTIIHDSELEACKQYIQELSDCNVDALIVQDLGIMNILMHEFPKLQIHASTQMHIHNIEGIKKCREWNLDRCVVARESSLSLIDKMCQHNIEVETFVQGAYCVSYSGECHMSRNNGGRSANRGECAQSCRLPYSLYKMTNGKKEQIQTKGEYLLSLKDLNAIEVIPELIKSGVSSFKIEGRMKRPEYVACMCRIYRQAIDAYYANQPFSASEVVMNEMKKIFNRGFTSGYLENKQGLEMTSSLRPNHQGVCIGKVVGFHHDKMVVELTGELNQHDGIRILNKKCDQGFIVNYLYKNGKLVNHAENERIELDKMNVAVGDLVMKTSDFKQLKELSLLPQRKLSITMKVKAYIGEPFELILSDSENEITVHSENVVERAITQSLDNERIKKQLCKLGNTPFVCDEIEIDCGENISFPISSLNQVRREGVELFIQKRMSFENPSREIKKRDIQPVVQTHKLSVNILNEEQYEVIQDYPVDIYIENEKLFKQVSQKRNNVYRNYPRVNHHGYQEAGLIHDVGGLKQGMHASSYMNCVNAYSAHVLFNAGCESVGLSYECSDEDISTLIREYEKLTHQKGNFEVEVYGRVENMVMENCLIMSQLKKKKHCQECHQNEIYLEDKKNKAYRLIGDDDCHLKLYHSECFDTIEKMDDYQNMGVTNFRISLTFEDEKTIKEIVEKALKFM